jgi:cytochrome c peroxidase
VTPRCRKAAAARLAKHRKASWSCARCITNAIALTIGKPASISHAWRPHLLQHAPAPLEAKVFGARQFVLDGGIQAAIPF